jgi:hypothetical protein
MKKTEIEKLTNQLTFNVTGYISNSMIIKNNHNKLNVTETLLLKENTFKVPDANKSFDLFAHILEG